MRYRSEFRKVAVFGKKLTGQYLTLECRQATSLKLGISASTRFGIAVQRNRFKRLVKEAFRLSQRQLPSDCEIHAMPRKLAQGASFEAIHSELLSLLAPWLD